MKRIKNNSTINILATEWLDKVNGNSYFSGTVEVNGTIIVVMPFQYGYGDQYRYEAIKQLLKVFKLPSKEASLSWVLEDDCRLSGISFTFNKFETLKRDMIK